MDTKSTVAAEAPTMSEAQAIDLLNRASPNDIERLRRLQKNFMKAWAGRHNVAREQRARARILKRKGKWKSSKAK